MVGVIVTSAFGTLYLERQLKASPKARKDMRWVGMGWDGVGVGSVLLTTHNRPEVENQVRVKMSLVSQASNFPHPLEPLVEFGTKEVCFQDDFFGCQKFRGFP